MDKVADLLKKRAAAFDAFKALAEKPEKTEDERKQLPELKRAVVALDEDVETAKELQRLGGLNAQPVEGQDPAQNGTSVQVRERDPYSNEEDAKAMGLGSHLGLRAVAALKLFNQASGNPDLARTYATQRFGERHSITRAFAPRVDPNSRALVTSVGASGGFIVPPDYVNEIIEFLRPLAVVRSSQPRVLPMPRGTMTMPSQESAATASYGTEVGAIASSQQALGQVVASFKKLTALCPVSNDMMRYSDPAVDAFVRDDLTKVIGLREDLAFILGNGAQSSPFGWLYFANRWVLRNSGTGGIWSTTANSTYAANGADPANSTGGNFITSTEAYTLATVANELGGAVNRLDTANASSMRRVWFMNPRSKNYLYNVQNSLGVYVWREEMNKGTLNGYPFRTTTQIGANYYDTNGAHTDCSFVFLVEMFDDVILDSMSLELAISREGTYVDASSNTVSAFQSDQTIIRAIAEHDHQMRHDQSIAVIQGVRWAPAIS